jgi:hypothetical protein
LPLMSDECIDVDAEVFHSGSVKAIMDSRSPFLPRQKEVFKWLKQSGMRKP